MPVPWEQVLTCLLQFGGTVLSTIFHEKSEKWEALSLFHVSNAIALVHDYIFQLLSHLCPEKQILDQLWDGHLIYKLSELYRKAMDHARFLLAIERGRPITFNHYFNDILKKKRAERLAKSMDKMTELQHKTGQRLLRSN